MSIGLLAAFAGGLISLLSPCSAMVIPTFSAAAAGSSGKFFKTSLIFTLGLFFSLIPLVLAASAIGVFLMVHRPLITTLIGGSLLIVGVLVLFGHHLPFPDFSRLLLNRYHSQTKASSIFVLGLISGLGSTTCVGPILGAIVSLAAASANLTHSAFLLIAYGLGITLPLILISAVYQQVHPRLLFKPLHRQFSLGSFRTSFNHLLTATLFFVVAYIFIRHQGTLGSLAIFTRTGLIDRMFEWQNAVINW